jgi:hypothetical protein
VQTRYTAEQMDAELAAQKAVLHAGAVRAPGRQGCDPAPRPDLHRRPAACGLDAARADSGLSQPGGRHAGIAQYHRDQPGCAAASASATARAIRGSCTSWTRTSSQLGERYISETAIHRKGAPFFTDKMPNNFRHIGLIKLILPNAKIIDARRHPMACCFSGFKQLFAEGQEFTYGLEEIGAYYRGYVELMDHWDAVLPGQILRVIYEDVVSDLEAQVRRILDYCGLPFEQACVDFHKTGARCAPPAPSRCASPSTPKALSLEGVRALA